MCSRQQSLQKVWPHSMVVASAGATSHMHTMQVTCSGSSRARGGRGRAHPVWHGATTSKASNRACGPSSIHECTLQRTSPLPLPPAAAANASSAWLSSPARLYTSSCPRSAMVPAGGCTGPWFGCPSERLHQVPLPAVTTTTCSACALQLSVVCQKATRAQPATGAPSTASASQEKKMSRARAVVVLHPRMLFTCDSASS